MITEEARMPADRRAVAQVAYLSNDFIRLLIWLIDSIRRE
jgi:hypothetical protein